MSILVVYTALPSFPATDQNPTAQRIQIGSLWADYTDTEPTEDDVNTFLHPPGVPHLNSGMLIRFSATNPIVVYENLGLAGVSRLTKGRYRINHINPMPSDQYSVFPDVMDAADKRARYTVRTVDYVEVKVVDTAGAAADASEVSVKIERVITPT